MKRSEVNLGVLSFHNSKETKSLLNVADGMGFEPVWISDRNLKINMHSDGLEIEPNVDVVLNRMLLSNTRSPIELLGITDAISQKVPVLNHPRNVMTILNKISATAGLSNKEGINVPESCFSPRSNCLGEIDSENIVQKRAIGTHGSSVHLARNEDSMISETNGRYSFSQDLVEQDGNEEDIRVYVVGDEIISVMRREAADDEWKTNIAKGATAYDEKISEDLENQIVELVDYFNIDYAGVDMMINKDGDAKILEVNPTAGFRGLFNATEICPAPHIVSEAAERIGFEVDSNEIDQYKNELDDSIPDCRPTRKIYGKPKIGVTEKVYLAGYSDQFSIDSKVDTGATRTSIDIELAAELGLGPIKNFVSVKSGNSKESSKRPIVPLTLKLKGLEHHIDASVEDREHMNYDIILGRDILKNYQIVPDENLSSSGDEE